MQSFWELRHEFVDTVINCENGQSTFSAHKIILAAASPILREILRSSNILTFPDVSKCDMESVIESIYKRSPDSFLKVGKLEKSLATRKTKKSTSIEQLPPEVLVNIFSFLSTTDLLNNIALVSNQFHTVTKLPSAHKIVHLSSCAPNIDKFLKTASSMTKLHFFSKSGCKYAKITPHQLVNSIGSHDNLRDLNFLLDLHAPFLYFIPLSSSKWWANLTQFNMEFDAVRYRQLSILPEFDSALRELGTSGNLTHFGVGSQGSCSPSSAVFNFLLGPTLSKLRCLTLYDNYDWPMLEEISTARKDSLENLYIPNIYMSIHIPNIPNLEVFETRASIKSLDNLPSLQKLKCLKILRFERGCKILPNCLPNLTHLEIGSVASWGLPGNSNKVIYYTYVYTFNCCIDKRGINCFINILVIFILINNTLIKVN